MGVGIRGGAGVFYISTTKICLFVTKSTCKRVSHFFSKKIKRGGEGMGGEDVYSGPKRKGLRPLSFLGTKFYQKNLKSKPRPFNTPARA